MPFYGGLASLERWQPAAMGGCAWQVIVAQRPRDLLPQQVIVVVQKGS